MKPHHYVAVDLGAESGRVMLGALADEKLTLEEIHRFSNGPAIICGTWRWDVLKIFEEIKIGLRKIAERRLWVDSISADSWGVDYVLLHGHEPMLTAPFHYRDARTDGGFERAFAVVPREEIFAETGIQFMTLNTLFQMHADLTERRAILESANLFLTMGDYFNFLLCGARCIEESLASTTQLYNPREHAWSNRLIEKFGLPRKIFPRVVTSGTSLGTLLPVVTQETGLNPAQVVASCSHDTGAAVAAVPAQGEGWAYLSSGTWSLLGIESPQPVINAKSLEYNFTNEVGFGGSIRFLKNIVGLWIIQECRRAWEKEGHAFSYDELTRSAEASEPLKSLINPNDPRFIKPGQMPQKIADYCRETGQPIPATSGEYVRCVLESLALLYRATLDRIEEVTGQSRHLLHIVGGGSRNHLLNQFSADATGRTVIAGPVECTAIGNCLVQAIALNHLPSLEALRRVVRQSFPLFTYQPQQSEGWREAVARFSQLPQ